MEKYFIANGEQRRGPYPLDELLKNGLTPDTQLIVDGATTWVRAAEVPQVAALLAAGEQPPLPPSPPSVQSVEAPAPVIEAQPVFEAWSMSEFYESIRVCFANYANFKGRARRSEFWWFVLFAVILTSLTMGVGFLAVAVPLAAVSVRRLHDISHTLTITTGSAARGGRLFNLGSVLNYGEWCVAFHFLIFAVVAVLFYLFFVFFTPSFAEETVFKVLASVLLVATVVMVALYCLDSDKKDNRHGLSPKYFLSSDVDAGVACNPRMGFLMSIATCYKKYFNYSGRARRSELWWFVLYSAIVTTIIFSIRPLYVYFGTANFHIGFIDVTYNKLIFVFAVFLPLWAAIVRRLHDTNHDGMWMLVFVLFLSIAFLINEMYTHFIRMSFYKWFSGLTYIYSMPGRNIFMEIYSWGLLITSLAFMTAIVTLCCLDSDKVSNQYGWSPKYGTQEEME